jgi:hypothetical protein
MEKTITAAKAETQRARPGGGLVGLMYGFVYLHGQSD